VATVDLDLGAYQLGWRDEVEYAFTPRKGLDEDVIRDMSAMKKEPEWMLEFRLKAYQRFLRKPIPQWGGGGALNTIDFDDIYYYVKPAGEQAKDWDMVPESIKATYEKLGIPQAERKYLAGVTAQYESEVVYHRNREDLEKLGVLFTDMDTALREYPDIVKEYFGTVIPPNDNKFAALNSAVWSGGSFIYVPPGVHVDQPLQAYFRINSENMGQFERTLIIVDEGAYVHYVEGCSAPVYTTDSLHAAVVEIVVKENGRCRYTTIQNWSNNVFNLVTKRAAAYRNATMEWVDGNLGSRLTMKYPAVWLMEPGAHGEVLSIAFAGEGQHQDAGAKIIHVAEDTTSTIVSKSISKGGGRAGYRGLVRVEPGAENAKSFVRCDALILDEESRSDTYPYMEIEENDAEIGHEATVSKVGEEQLFYLMSRGLTEDQATTMIVAGFIEPIVKELPMEYAVEMNRLIELNMAEAGAMDDGDGRRVGRRENLSSCDRLKPITPRSTSYVLSSTSCDARPVSGSDRGLPVRSPCGPIEWPGIGKPLDHCDGVFGSRRRRTHIALWCPHWRRRSDRDAILSRPPSRSAPGNRSRRWHRAEPPTTRCERRIGGPRSSPRLETPPSRSPGTWP
jgi:Fe-S cluster assembly protein SufB